MTKRTLEERCYERRIKRPGWTDAEGHVRAELDRLAGQVRKLQKECIHPGMKHTGVATCIAMRLALNDVLDLLKEAKK